MFCAKPLPQPVLETARLLVFPLPPPLFRTFLTDKPAAEASLGLAPSGTDWDPDTRAAMESLLTLAEKLPRRQLEKGSWRWYANWQIVLKGERFSVGSACFMGRPTAAGWVELGYGVDPEQRGRGYMTEAAAALSGWAVSQPGVKTVRAQTARDNPASCRVLEKCGFRLIRTLSAPSQKDAEELLWEYGGPAPVV